MMYLLIEGDSKEALHTDKYTDQDLLIRFTRTEEIKNQIVPFVINADIGDYVEIEVSGAIYYVIVRIS